MSFKIEDIVQIRHILHANPELSAQESQTAALTENYLKKLGPTQLLSGIGGYGVAAIFDSMKIGFTLCFRAELDALPITETGISPYTSKNRGISHACGHDGHASILLGFAHWLKCHPDDWTGRVILLFQPAEETAEGALQVLADKSFTDLNPDFVIGMHNLPGFPLHRLIYKGDTFASASCGLKLHLLGKTSHAGHPEGGNSPLDAMLAITQFLSNLIHNNTDLESRAMITIIHLRLGEEAFGTSPGEADVMATYRAYDDETLQKLISVTEQRIDSLARAYGLGYTLTWVEKFAATVNDIAAGSLVQSAARRQGLEIIQPQAPFPWSEDFSYYSSRFKCAFFGLGSGENHPQLHNPDYDFPDQLMETAITLYANILKEAEERYAALQLD